jgi:Membrane protein involved in the export of O-antigen and teichoic acid
MEEKKSKSKNLVKGMLIYAIGNFGSKVLLFLIVPVYTYYISTEDMGKYDLMMTTINLLTPIVTMQISDAAYRWMIREEEGKEVYICSSVQVLVINCFIASLIITLINLIFPFRYSGYFILTLITSRVLATIQKLLRGLKNQKLFALSGITYTIIFLAFNIIQICYLAKGIESLFLSAIIANLAAVVLIFALEKELRIPYLKKMDLGIVKTLLKFSVPLVPNQLNWWIINSSDRYVISFFLNASANGIYSISYKFPTMLQVILSFFTTSWQDVAVSDTTKDSGQFYTGVFKHLYMLSFGLLWVLNPATKMFIQLFMNANYHSAAEYISFLYLGTVFQSFASFYGVGYLRDRKTNQAASSSIYGAVVNALINIVLIKFIGLQAASISTFLGFLVMWLIRERQNRRELGVVIDIKLFLQLFLITILLSIIECFTDIYIDSILLVLGGIMFLSVNRNAMNAVRVKFFQRYR